MSKYKIHNNSGVFSVICTHGVDIKRATMRQKIEFFEKSNPFFENVREYYSKH